MQLHPMVDCRTTAPGYGIDKIPTQATRSSTLPQTNRKGKPSCHVVHKQSLEHTDRYHRHQHRRAIPHSGCIRSFSTASHAAPTTHYRRSISSMWMQFIATFSILSTKSSTWENSRSANRVDGGGGVTATVEVVDTALEGSFAAEQTLPLLFKDRGHGAQNSNHRLLLLVQ